MLQDPLDPETTPCREQDLVLSSDQRVAGDVAGLSLSELDGEDCALACVRSAKPDQGTRFKAVLAKQRKSTAQRESYAPVLPQNIGLLNTVMLLVVLQKPCPAFALLDLVHIYVTRSTGRSVCVYR